MCTLCDVLEISNRVHELVRQLKPFSTVTCGTKHLDKGVPTFFPRAPLAPPPLHAPSLAGRDLLASHSMHHEQGDPRLRRYSILLLHSRNDCLDRFVAQL